MKAIQLILLAAAISLIVSSEHKSTSINLNQKVSGKSSQKNIQFYKLQIDNNSQKQDLLIDSKTLNSKSIYESPIVMISPKPLTETAHKDLFVCGQLGNETCIIPSNKLTGVTHLFVGVVCDNCKFNIKAYYINEPILKDGESQIFHLKEGDKFIFKLDKSFKTEKDLININSFNMRMTPYKMQVEMMNKNDSNDVINVKTIDNWVGGQQAIIKNSAKNNLQQYQYRIIFTAEKDGIFDVEAKSSNSISRLTDKSLKFDTVNHEVVNCYAYKIPKETLPKHDELVFEMKSIRGDDFDYYIFPDNNNLNNIKYYNNEKLNGFITAKGQVKGKDSKKIVLDMKMRRKQTTGDWKICIKTEQKFSNAMYTIQAYLASNHYDIKEYQKLLFHILNNEEMYSVHNVQLQDGHKETPILRMLGEVEKNMKDAETNLIQGRKTDASIPLVAPLTLKAPIVYIHINGIGVGGIAVGFIFTFAILIGMHIMMVIFVNTKTIDEPLRMGRIEH